MLLNGPSQQNKTIQVWPHILVLVPVGLLLSKYLSFCLGKRILVPRDVSWKARPMFVTWSTSQSSGPRLLPMMRMPRNNCLNLHTTSCLLLIMKPVVVSSTKLMRMVLLCGQMGNLAVVTNMSSSRVVKDVVVDRGWHSTSSAVMNCALTKKFIVAKYSSRWLNRRTFTDTVPSLNFQLPQGISYWRTPCFKMRMMKGIWKCQQHLRTTMMILLQTTQMTTILNLSPTLLHHW